MLQPNIFCKNNVKILEKLVYILVTKILKLSKIYNLALKHSELIKEWDHKKNKELLNLTPYDVTFGSHTKVWWICNKGHEWESQIHNRTGKHKTGCPESICVSQKWKKTWKRNRLAKKMLGQKPITDFK